MTSKTIDPDAVEINALHRKAQEAAGFYCDIPEKAEKIIKGTVTDRRKFSGNLSSSRNADACSCCDKPFMAGQMRHVLTLAHESVCSDCFEGILFAPSPPPHLMMPSIADLRIGPIDKRGEIKCEGCGEPIWTIQNAKARYWYFCSNRCYQRVYRKRRRGRPSTVEWKAHASRHYRCECCKRPLKRKDGESYKSYLPRKDARYCSSRCRQWAYRRRAGGKGA